MKTALLLVALLAFSSELFAENSVENKSKILYGSEEELSVIRQKDIDALIAKGYSTEKIALVGTLYTILDKNSEGVDLSTFTELMELQKKSSITIEYLDDLGIANETMSSIKRNDSLVKGLGIDIHGKTSGEKLVSAHAQNEEAHAQNEEALEERKKLGKILFANGNKIIPSN